MLYEFYVVNEEKGKVIYRIMSEELLKLKENYRWSDLAKNWLIEKKWGIDYITGKEKYFIEINKENRCKFINEINELFDNWEDMDYVEEWNRWMEIRRWKAKCKVGVNRVL